MANGELNAFGAGGARVALHFSPHPDDESIGAPATLMALRDAGFHVVNVACSLGRPAQWARREAELREACRLARFEPRFPPRSIDISLGGDRASAETELAALVRETLGDLRPEVVLSPSPHDRHRGHELVARAVRDGLAEQGEHAPHWWMWGLWISLPLPTLATAFGQERLDEIFTVLSAHRGELDRNDYRRLVRHRAAMSVSLGSELLFGFGAEAPSEVPYAELLTEVVRTGDRWLLGRARWLDQDSPLAASSEVAVDGWLLDPSVTDRFGAPGVQGVVGEGPGEHGMGLDSAEQARLWEFTLHEDDVFNQRHTLFLVAEAMLTVAFATALNAKEKGISLAIAILGLLLTLTWLYVSRRHGFLVDLVQRRAKQTFPEYAELYRERGKEKRRLQLRSRTVAGLVVPVLVGLMWVVLIFARA